MARNTRKLCYTASRMPKIPPSRLSLMTSESSPLKKASKPKTHLAPDDIDYILKAAGDGQNQRTIAAHLNCAQSSVFKVIRGFSPTEPLAKLFARANALNVAKSSIRAALKAARQGKGAQCLEILDRLEVLPKREAQISGQARVQIAVMMPGQSLALDTTPPRFIDAAEKA